MLTTAPEGAAKVKIRPRLDVQGLRAVAVLAVIANHLWDNPRGGFVGVDVFFVLSGYLITGLLIREQQRSGRISYVGFYRRRIRRIIPAATLVIVATVGATYYSFNSTRGLSVAKDGIWAFFFASNWHFAAVGTDYFRDDGLISPLQHFWSLAVEEQFYIIWPTLLVLTLVALKHIRASVAGLVVVTSGVTAVSFAYSMWHTGQSPTNAYFSTFDRAWELGVGALLAVAAPAIRKLPAAVAPVLGWAGLVAIGGSFWAISGSSRFPAPWAALPVLGAAAVVAAGEGRSRTFLSALTNPVAQYIGDISYSLYLWHFPVIIVLLAFVPDRGLTYEASVLVTTALVSVLSYHLVEDRIRRSQWLEPRAGRSRSSTPETHRFPLRDVLLVCAVVAVAGLTALALRPPTAPAALAFDRVAPAAEGTTTQSESQPVSTLVATQQQAVETALRAREFPNTNGLGDLTIESLFAELEQEGCVNVPDVESQLPKCRFGSGPRTAVVLGDSYAMAWMPGLRKALLPARYTIQQMTLGQCPVWNAPVLSGGVAYPECESHREFTISQTQRIKPDLLILASSQTDVTNLADGGNPAQTIQAGMTDTLTKLQGAATRTVILSPPPNSGSLQVCMTRGSVPDDCVMPPGEDWTNMSQAERAAAAAVPGTEYIDTESWFCAADLCPAFTDSSPIRADGSHLTVNYSEGLAPLLAEALASG